MNRKDSQSGVLVEEETQRQEREGILGKIVAGVIATGTAVGLGFYLKENPDSESAFGAILAGSTVIGLCGSYIASSREEDSYNPPRY